MQWNTSKHAGFTHGEPWIRVNPNYFEINAEEQLKNPESVYNYYKKLIQIRHKNDIVVYGTYDLLMPESEEVYAYTRTLGQEKLLIVCNFTDRLVNYDIPREFEERYKDVIVSNYEDDLGRNLRPYEAKVYKIVRR